MQQKRYVVFGAGQAGLSALAQLKSDGHEVIALSDNDLSLKNQTFASLPFCCPQDLPAMLEREDAFVHIASWAVWPIYEQMQSLGIPVERICAPLLEENNRAQLAALHKKHLNQPIFIVGNGPSLRIEDLDHLHSHNALTIAFNKIYLAFEQTDYRPDYYMVEDRLVAENNASRINALSGVKKLFTDSLLTFLHPDEDTLLYGQNIRKHAEDCAAFSSNPYFFEYGATVAYSGMQLAIYMGCNPIYLIGIDYNFNVPQAKRDADSVLAQGEQNHFHPEYRNPGERWTIPDQEYTKLAYEAALEHSKKKGSSIMNATRGGQLEVFPRVDFDSLFQG